MPLINGARLRRRRRGGGDLLAAAVVGFFAHHAAGRTGQGARAAAAGATGPAAEADRMRAALLAAVGHDLRSPLAAAAAAVSCLRSADLQLTAADQDELLATAEESLDLVSRLAATLLDVTRLQAGARSVFPRPADLEEIIAGSLAGCSASSFSPSSRCSCCDRLLRARAWSPSRRTFAGRHVRRSGCTRWVYSSAMRAACQLNAPPRLTLEATCRNHRFPRLR
jgi:signal transduction histidine kinase